MTPIAAARLIQIPTPRPAKKKSSGMETTRTSTKIVASEPSAIVTRLSGVELPQEHDEHRRQPDEEHELAERAGVPAEHRDRHALARARIPAGERRDGEDEPADERQAIAEAEEGAATVERSTTKASFGRRHGAQYGGRTGWSHCVPTPCVREPTDRQ